MRRAVFLDRDGTLNRAPVRDGRPYSPATLEEFEILADVPGALRRLREAGFLLIVVTNQPDVATGRQDRTVVEAMHDHLRTELLIDDFKVCYETEAQAPDRFKPAPGMIHEAARENGIDLAASFMIGDRWRDVGAGQAAGCKTIFIDRGYRERQPMAADWTVRSLGEAADIVVRQVGKLGA